MKKFLFFILLTFQISAYAQPTFIGTMAPDGNYQTYNLNDLGAFRQVRLQATSSAGSDARIWEFATGNYFENWRPYSFPTTIVANQVINPSTEAGSARYNSGFGGASSYLPAITSGNYYTFNVTEFNPPTDQFMSFLETSFEPVTINSVTASPVGDPAENEAVTIMVTTSNSPSSGEQVFIRYSTDNFTTSNLVPLSFSGGTGFSANTGTAQIPGLSEGTTVQYYVYSSNITEANILSSVASNGELAHDMLTLNFNNDGGLPYSYVVQAALPVVLNSFELKTQANGIDLKWETAMELNNSHFEVQKSTDTREWINIGKVSGNGTTDEANQYNFLDKNPVLGRNYYRLKQLDYDAVFSYSSILFSDWREDTRLSIYPNPATNQIFFKDFNTDTQNLIIRIMDTSGRIVLETQMQDNHLDISHLTNGIYLLECVENGKLFQQKIVVQN